MNQQRKPVTKNPANKKSFEDAQKTLETERKEQINDIKEILKTPEGRRFYWRILCECKVFGKVFQPNSNIYREVALQDFGKWLMAEVIEADEELLFQMMKESKMKHQKEN